MAQDQMSGKVCLVTGATAGIGYETALELARRGARVLIVSRDAARGEATTRALREASGSDQVELCVADLASLSDIRRLGAEVRTRCARLDVLVNNAGGIYPDRRVTSDGLELTFALNHMAYFALTLELLPLLKASAPARIVNVASGAHRGSRLALDDLQSEHGYRPFKAYSRSKLANILFTRELARRLEGSGVTVNAAHPGAVASRFGRDLTGVVAFLFKLGQPFLLTPQQGARTSIYLATSPDVAGISGKYFAKERESTPSAAAQDAETARRLWEESERLLAAA